jgi:hypothetical protein
VKADEERGSHDTIPYLYACTGLPLNGSHVPLTTVRLTNTGLAVLDRECRGSHAVLNTRDPLISTTLVSVSNDVYLAVKGTYVPEKAETGSIVSDRQTHSTSSAPVFNVVAYLFAQNNTMTRHMLFRTPKRMKICQYTWEPTF